MFPVLASPSSSSRSRLTVEWYIICLTQKVTRKCRDDCSLELSNTGTGKHASDHTSNPYS